MKKRTILVSLLAICCVAMFALAFMGCGIHVHSYNVSKWVATAEGHYHTYTCEHEGKTDLLPHTDENGDELCDACGYDLHVHTVNNEEWVNTDSSGHYHLYSCGHEGHSEVEPHIDENSDELCDVCGYDLHVHTCSDSWVEDDPQGHYHLYNCGHEGHSEVEAHVDVDNNGLCDVCGYEVAIVAESVTLDKQSLKLKPGETEVLTATVYPAEAVGEFSWASDNQAVATVENGVVTAVAAGQATVTATFGGVVASCQVTVKAVEYEEVSVTADFTDPAISGYTSSSSTTPDYTAFGRFTLGKGTYVEGKNAGLKLDKGNVNTQKKKDAVGFTLAGVDGMSSISFTVKGASSGTPELYMVAENGTQTLVKAWDKAEGQVNVGTGRGFDDVELKAGKYILGSSDGSIRIGNLTITEMVEKSEAVKISVSSAPSKELVGREFSSTGLIVTLHYANGRTDVLSGGYTVDSSAVNMNVAGVYEVKVSYLPEEGEAFEAAYEYAVYNIDSLELSDHVLDSKRVTLPVQKVFGLGQEFNYNNLAVTAKCSVPGVSGQETFYLSSAEYSVSNVTDVNVEGAKTVTVTVGNVQATYTVYYIDVNNADKLNVVVDSANSGVTKSGNVFTVQTVNQAIQTLKLLGAEDKEVKTVTVKAGSYYEKVEIDIPNVKLIGDGATAKDTVLWCDILAGYKDASGKVGYSTDGSASVSIRAAAEGFYAENITFKNYYNTNALYEESRKLFGDTQAVACLVQADKAYFKNCFFTSYHDTLYAMDGRQVYDSCEIEGRTDYIFGAASTCYFKNCLIRTIGANSKTNGGYIVATKGTTGLLYGYIFDGCTLTADENVVDGTVSLARGWEANMTLAFVNCNISAAYSVTPYQTKTDGKNERYTKMNAAPVAAQLFEYNNTGAGALPQDVIASANANGVIEGLCTYLDGEQAAQFTNLATVFAKVQVRSGAKDFTTSYTKNWDGSQGAEITEVTYDFAVNPSATFEEYFAEVFEVSGGNGRWNGNSVQLPIGTKLTFKVQGKVYITWYGAPYGAPENGVVTYKDGYATIEIVDSEGNKGVYVVSVKLDLTDVPEDTQTGGNGGEGEVTTVKHELVITAHSTAYKEEELINDIFYATPEVKTEGNKIEGSGYSIQYSLTKGKLQYDSSVGMKNGIKFTVTANATVTVVAGAKSDKSVTLSVLGDEAKAVTVKNIQKDGAAIEKFDVLPTASVSTYTFEVEAGTYYIGGSGGGAYLYALVVEEVSENGGNGGEE